MTRRLPTHTITEPRRLLIANPDSSRAERIAVRPDAYIMGALTVAVVAATVASIAGIHAGVAYGITAAALGAFITWIVTTRRTLERNDHIIAETAQWAAPTRHQLVALGVARDQTRALAADTHGHLIDDATISDIERLMFQAARSAERERVLLAQLKRIGGNGTETAALRGRITADAHGEAQLVERYRETVEALRDAATEMYAAYDALGAPELTGLAGCTDTRRRALDSGHSNAERMRAHAAAARSLLPGNVNSTGAAPGYLESVTARNRIGTETVRR